jgi:hypothetical protein
LFSFNAWTGIQIVQLCFICVFTCPVGIRGIQLLRPARLEFVPAK